MPADVNISAIKPPIIKACSAVLSAFFLLFSPIKRAIVAVTPVPKPIVRPNIKKNNGILRATPVIASPPN